MTLISQANVKLVVKALSATLVSIPAGSREEVLVDVTVF